MRVALSFFLFGLLWANATFADCTDAIEAVEISENTIAEQVFIEFKTGTGRTADRAFERLWKEYYNTLVSYLASSYGSYHEAEDAAQKAFMKVWENRANFKVGTNFKAWLNTIARNANLDALRRSSNAYQKEDAVAYHIETALYDGEPDVTLPGFVRSAHHEIPTELIQLLPPTQKKVFLLVLNGMTNKDIAQNTGMSENAVANALFLAKNRIRELMGLGPKKNEAPLVKVSGDKKASPLPQPKSTTASNSLPIAAHKEPDKIVEIPINSASIETGNLVDVSEITPEFLKELPVLHQEVMQRRLRGMSVLDIEKETTYPQKQIINAIQYAKSMWKSYQIRLRAKNIAPKNVDDSKHVFDVAAEYNRFFIDSKKAEEVTLFDDPKNPEFAQKLKSLSQILVSRGPLFKMMLMDGFTIDEAANALNISRQKVIDRMVEVRKNVKEIFKEDTDAFLSNIPQLKEYMHQYFESEASVLSQKFIKALSQLSPRRRDVFRLFILEGGSYEKVEAALNINRSVVNSSIARAREDLKEILGENYEPLLWMSPHFKDKCLAFYDKNNPDYLKNKVLLNIAGLTEIQRRYFHEIYIRGRSYGDVARETGKDVSTVFNETKKVAERMWLDLEDDFNLVFKRGLLSDPP